MNYRIFNKTKGQVIATKVRYCNNIFSRMKGLLGTKSIATEEACWIIPCPSIHTIGMKYSIDAYFLNKMNQVVAIEKNLVPNKFSKVHLNAYSVVEFISGPSRNCGLGDQLLLEKTP